MMLVTERLTLREMTWEDRAGIAEILQDPVVMYAYEHAFSQDEVEEWMARQMERYRTWGFGLWAVHERSTGKLVGQCGITMQDWDGRPVPEVGYLFRRDRWGRGYATEAAKAARDYAFDTLHFPAVYAIIRDSNQPSQAVAGRLGMEPVGTQLKHYDHMDRPHIVYRISAPAAGEELTLDGSRFYLLDGGMGTMLQERGLRTGESPERLNLTHPEVVRDVHAAYVAAGADIITTNTFGASRLKMGCDPAPYIVSAIRLAREAGARLVAQDIGPLGAMLQPLGPMAFEEAYDSFAQQVRAGEAAGADLILIETMSDLLEAKAALLAARENSDKPVLVTMTFGEDGRTFLGTEPKTAAVTLTALGASAIGINCSLGPRELAPLVREMLQYTDLPVVVQPNAGLPQMRKGQTVYTVGSEEFAACAEAFLRDGAWILGGCCGTTPAHIAALRRRMEGRAPVRRENAAVSRVAGWQRVVELGERSILTVGERINPTGRKALREALYAEDYAYAAELAIAQEQEGADLLVINAGLPDIDEKKALPRLVQEVQRVSPLPLVLDSSDPVAMENAIRVYSGRPILNSVNGDRESMEAMLPLAAKYGCAIVVLAMDDKGIYSTAEGRILAAEKVIRAGEGIGVPSRDFLVDCLTMSAAASQDEAMVAVEATRLARGRGWKTILGVSNVSHGLPGRDVLNSAFLAANLAAGLNVAIMNTASRRMMETIAAAKVLMGQDPGAAAYISAFGGKSRREERSPVGSLQELIISGKRGEVPAAAEALLQTVPPLEAINGHIVPALDEVGTRYETGELFLPQLMASAEAAKAAFDVINRHLPQGAGEKGSILLATVKGDVHDIGKNIVRMLLENYGYRIIDLGRDVAPETVVEALGREEIPLVGLSSLMTTTAQNIAVTIRMIRQAGYTCKIMVGGAVVTQSFADQIGADFYAKDAAESARYAATVFGK